MAKKQRLDINNFTNVIKQIIPEWDGVAEGFSGNDSNYVQQEMGNLLDETPVVDSNGLTPMEQFLRTQEDV